MLANVLNQMMSGSLIPAAAFALLGFAVGYLITHEHARARRLYRKWAGLGLGLLIALWVAAVLTGVATGERGSESVLVKFLPMFVFIVCAVCAPLFCAWGFILRIGLDLRLRGRCSSCGYDLHGLKIPQRRCPECGAPVSSRRER